MKTTLEYTFFAKIYVGSRISYGDYPEHDTYEHLCKIVQDYCNANPVGVNIQKTKFVYVEGEEDGYIIEFINYPRFPDTPNNIKKKAMALGEILLKEMQQERLSIVCSDTTILLEHED